MTVTLIIECGVAQTRAALFENGVAIRFWFGPARGDEEKDQTPRKGRHFYGRVKSVNASLSAAFVDIGDGLDAFLPIKKPGDAVAEGALINVAVKSPPRQGKGAVLKPLPDSEFLPSGEGRKTTNDEAGDKPARLVPGRAPPFIDPAIEAANTIGESATTIVIDDAAARAALTAAGVTADIQYEEHFEALFDDYGASEELEKAFGQTVALNGGGRLVIDEAQALTAIDVDSGALSASSSARLREKMALTAADEAMRQVRLRNIGGHVVIDFPAIGAKSARAKFRERLTIALSRIEGAGTSSFSKSGLFTFTAPHGAQSLIERFTETVPGDPVSGRRFTLDWQAKSALREAEHRLRAGPKVKLKLNVGAALFEYLNAQQIWIDRLNDRYGPRVDITKDEKLEERGYDLSE